MDTKTFNGYLKLKSEDFSFPENSDLLISVEKPADLPWLKQDSIGKIPNWACLLIGGLVLLFSLLGIFIGLLIRHVKKKAERAHVGDSLKVITLEVDETPEEKEHRSSIKLKKKISELSAN